MPSPNCKGTIRWRWSIHEQSLDRQLKPGDHVGTLWVVDEGLKPGDRVVARAYKRFGPESTVVPQPAGGKKSQLTMSKFFIDRPIVAMVIALFMVIIGGD